MRQKSPGARLCDAQREVAREYGFASWRKLKAHIDVISDPSGLLTTFTRAVEQADADAVARCLSLSPALTRAMLCGKDPHGETALHRVDPKFGVEVTDAHLRIAALLIDHGADINAKGWPSNQADATPLMHPSWLGHAKMVAVLLERGADPNITDCRQHDGGGWREDPA